MMGRWSIIWPLTNFDYPQDFVFNEDLIIKHWLDFLLVARQQAYVRKNCACVDFHYVSQIDEIMHLIWCTLMVVRLFHNRDSKQINYKFVMIVNLFRIFLEHFTIFWFFQLKCVCDLPYTMENPLPSFLSIKSSNFNKSYQHPFVGPLRTILELALAINSILKWTQFL